ncbi:uncharacterized protein LOC123313023 [Coccinella septempunctata]|uniref:uncharacterized protein LOC123313023 n=1 Tax=Coccinella septempunctata TaxID=41139 RepID=UPI001D0907A5|nr:uncharacterized protein LOC123313023 [Coccinella septempunctata]
MNAQAKKNFSKTQVTRKLAQLRYKETDKAPFSVIIESKNNNIHPMNIGKILAINNIEGIKQLSRKGANKVAVDFKNFSQANDFIDNETIFDENYLIYVPSRLVTCRGVISDVGSDVVDDDILNCESPIKIVSARRLNKRKVENGKVNYVPFASYLITFEGKTLPKYLGICYNKKEVKLYISPVIQCYNCLRYGHTKKLCRGKKRCRRCGENHEEAESEYDMQYAKCVFCKENNNHESTNRLCPEYSRQKAIREKMAVDNLSYFEAEQFFRSNNLNTRNVQAFPALPSQSSRHSRAEVVEAPHRRLLLKTPMKPYSNIVASPKKRKNPSSSGYDSEKHKMALTNYSPARAQSNGFMFQSENKINSDNRPSSYTREGNLRTK